MTALPFVTTVPAETAPETGTVTGTGPRVQVQLAPSDHHAPARMLSVDELPEEVSATLLARCSLDDQTVLG